ncbi:MAG TPA: nucleoside recognition domain-containing protein [Candidatus Sulfotelmatobacter sp.]|jgi:spore maturation protein SpmA|nr:nucleoside recognition domain-containing protein [Candidatus Sulfotelmatobacter sp.]
MLNYIWLLLMVAAVLIGGWNGKLKDVADGAFNMANTSVLVIAFGLIGVMALWLGVMRLAERAGLVALFARAMRPLMRVIFPDVPPEHPAMGSMLMNISANMLGLGNAATPLGLRAMRDLESLNKIPGTATNAMCTFLAINTSGIQLIPATAIAILAASKSTNPTAIVGTSIICTACAATAGVLMAKFLEKLPMFALPRSSRGNEAQIEKGQSLLTSAGTEEKIVVKEAATLQPLRWWGQIIFAAFLIFFVVVFLRTVFPQTFGLPVPEEAAPQSLFIRIVNAVSLLAIPFLLSAIPLFAILRRVKVYEEFVDGAKEGFDVAIRIIPYLVAMLVAVGMFRAAGGIDLLSKVLSPVLSPIHFPTDLLPMVLVRPLSGSGSLGLFTELVNRFGPDSLIARTAGTIYGSTETTFYVLAVYFGSVAIRKTRHAVIAGLTADFVGVVAAVTVCRIVFR